MLTCCDCPAASVGVERVFSQGRLTHSHLRNRLEVQMMRALLCVGEWSQCGLINADALKELAPLPDVKAGEKSQLAEDWDAIAK